MTFLRGPITNLKAILDSHAKWLTGEPGGERANFTRAILTNVDFTDANLSHANCTGANFTNVDLTRAECTGANFTDATLIGADCIGANFTDANLTGANFTDANLTRTNFTRATLIGANFTRATLIGANFTRVILTNVNFTHADLTRADFTDADLTRATLIGAILVCTILSAQTRIETGETWQEYLNLVVPAFLTAGGRPLEEVATPDHWECHSWNNCPTAAAFGCHSIEGVPLLLQPRAEQFIQYFDDGLIPLAAIRKEASV